MNLFISHDLLWWEVSREYERSLMLPIHLEVSFSDWIKMLSGM